MKKRKIRYGNRYEVTYWNSRKAAVKMLWLFAGVFLLLGVSGCQNRQDSTSHMVKNTDTESGKEETEEEAVNELGNKSEGKSENQSNDNTDKEIQNTIEDYMGTLETKESQTETVEATKEIVIKNKNAIEKGGSVYDCDLAEDKNNYDGHVDITVGDRYYATQINDWYMNFDQYEGKVVEIEGYYINDFAPYDLIGRYGPSCPYCQGGYVSFEFLSDEDFSTYQSAEDWIKVTGILRKGIDRAYGDFYYIEALKVEKMDAVGVDTVTD